MIDKVAVLFGGNSSEREISIQSGKAVVNGLRNSGIDAHPVDIRNFSVFKLKEIGYKKAFIALHGRGGEDGSVQGVLKFLGLPYTGSGILSSSLSMDKVRTKQLWTGIGLLNAPYISLDKNKLAMMSDSMLFKLTSDLGLPLIVKPTLEGSSIGISKVTTLLKLRMALELAFRYDKNVLIEKYINGPEYSVAIIGDNVMPSIRIQPAGGFYDYNAKYFSNETQYFCPSELKAEEEVFLRELALSAYKAIGCSGCGRVDIMRDSDGVFYLLEINTAPGMTDRSLVAMSAKKVGMDFSELVKKILELAE
ncbi:MAG: D-alanine--D-alanine ligase [Arsenophonus sp.]